MKGFTLVESLISIALLAVAIVGISSLVLFFYKSYSYSRDQSEAIEEAKRGIETMIQEIRKAQNADNGAYVIEEADDFQFIFYSDIDKDGEVEKVRYFVENNEFKKGVIEPVGIPATYPQDQEKIFILSQYVRNTPPVFQYFDGDGNELPPPARKRDTKLMRLTLEIDVDPQKLPSPFTLVSEVQIRNIKTNL